MKAIRLIAAADEYDTAPGLIIKGTPSFEGLMADRTGLMIAHDLLEHQNGMKAMGPVWDELEALGGVWYVRGQWGDLMQTTGGMYSPAQNLASDIERMFREWDGWNGPGGLSVGSRPSDYDEDFNEIIGYARDMIRREYSGEMDDMPDLDAYLRLSLQRMRSGFRKAAKRFEGHGQSRFNGNSLFKAVKEAVERAAKWIEFEGQEFVLRYGNGEASVREVAMLEDY